MGKIHSMMDVGKRAMMNNQTALQTVAHNIANKSTEGYSQQNTAVVTSQPIIEGNLQIGQGSRAAKVTRTNNPFVDKQLQVESGNLAFQTGHSSAMAEVESVFNEQSNAGLNVYISSFFNAFRELSNNPESTTTRTMVKEAGEALTRDFARVDTQLTKVQEGIDEQILNQVQQLNQFSKEVADLNEQISKTEVQGIPANDQRDRRDLVLKKMSEIVDIKVAEGDHGAVMVSSAGNAILVSGYDSMQLSTFRNPQTSRVEVYYKPTESHPPFAVTSRIRGGAMGGSLVVRDGIVNEMKAKVDGLARAMASQVNSVHIQGFDRQGRLAEAFFVEPGDEPGAASRFKVNESILSDVGKIATASRSDAPGDNTVANVISMLQHRQLMDGGTATFDDYYKSQVGQIGVLAQRAEKTREAQANVVKQVNLLRESISGVSLDEEATKMIEFQKAFEASARVIKTADEMFDTVLNLKRS